LPATLALQETVAVPDPVTLFGVMLPQVKPEGTVSVKLTTPAKWFTLATVIVVMEDAPAFEGLGGLAAIVKFRNWKREVAVWTSDPLVPVRVRV
jgi:hypothetical protein